jgi:hypothetical protein
LQTDELIDDLFNLGAIEEGMPNGFVPVFTGYVSVRFFEMPDGTKVQVYNWLNPSSSGWDDASAACTKAWHNGGNGSDSGCYGKGNECDLELRNGEWILICCDERAA